MRKAAAAQERLIGIDMARALAIIGMVIVHVGPRASETLADRLYNLPHGRASVLFVLLAGVGVSLLGKSRARALLAARIFWVALIFLPLGLGLQALDHGIAVILHHYAAYYLVALALSLLASRALALFAIVATIAGPALYLGLRQAFPDIDMREAVGLGASGLEIVRGLAWTGPYPLLTWTGILACGMWIGRYDLSDARVVRWLVVGGLSAMLLSYGAARLGVFWLGEPEDAADWRNLFDLTPHNQMTGWLVSAMGSAAATLSAGLIIARRFPRPAWPLAAFGQLALSFYVAHLIVLHFAADVFRYANVRGASWSVLLFAAGGIGFAVWWRRRFGKGPVEALMALPFARTQSAPDERRYEPPVR